MPPITEYVVGFLFDQNRSHVLLIRKNRPTWQAGKFNGVGGHVEPDETPLAAMDRGFAEEAGLSGLAWEPVSILAGDTWCVHFFAAFDQSVSKARDMTDEPLTLMPMVGLARAPLMADLPVMIALALDTSGIIKPVRMFDRIPQKDTAGEPE